MMVEVLSTFKTQPPMLIHAMSQRKVLSIGEPLPKLCKDCVHFRHNPLHNVQFAKCRRIFYIDLISGQKDLMYASLARETDCKGNHFEEKPKQWFEAYFIQEEC
jgi:hypothetical protein